MPQSVPKPEDPRPPCHPWPIDPAPIDPEQAAAKAARAIRPAISVVILVDRRPAPVGVAFRPARPVPGLMRTAMPASASRRSTAIRSPRRRQAQATQQPPSQAQRQSRVARPKRQSGGGNVSADVSCLARMMACCHRASLDHRCNLYGAAANGKAMAAENRLTPSASRRRGSGFRRSWCRIRTMRDTRPDAQLRSVERTGPWARGPATFPGNARSLRRPCRHGP